MGHVSRQFDHSLPNVRSGCILAKIYKAKKHHDQGGERKKRKEKDHKLGEER